MRRSRRGRVRRTGGWRLLRVLRRLIPGPNAWRRAWRLFRRMPPGLRLVGATAALFLFAASLNGAYQVARKPTELFFPVSDNLHKTPKQTWRAYAPLFRRHSTRTISAEFLAALAEVEASGNPLARTYWRWSWTLRPFDVYRPASSAVGMYQITDATFEEARRYCVHRHEVVEDGPWYDFRSCWLNALYLRVIPSHAVELTAAHLQHRVDDILRRYGIAGATIEQEQRLAAVIHLCGASAGSRYARRGFRVQPGQRCGDHRIDAYLSRIERARRQYEQLARAGRAG